MKRRTFVASAAASGASLALTERGLAQTDRGDGPPVLGVPQFGVAGGVTQPGIGPERGAPARRQGWREGRGPDPPPSRSRHQ
jgi:hypothetical protein